MGKGDKKSRRGKIIMGSFGVRRRRKKADKKEIMPIARTKVVEAKDKKPVKEKKEVKEVVEVKEVKKEEIAIGRRMALIKMKMKIYFLLTN